MSPFPRDSTLDASLALRREGYRFVGTRCRQLGSDGFRTRLLLRPVLCLRGREAAALLYDAERFTRRGAMPKRVQKLLQGAGSVQSLDDEAHRHRKRLFLDLTTAPSQLGRLGRLFHEHWETAARRWQQEGEVQLHAAVRRVLAAAACDWAGAPLHGQELDAATDELSAMIDGTGALGPRHWRARRLRARHERRIRRLVDRARDDTVAAPAGTPLHAVVTHRDLDGRLLDRGVAALELINLIRPTVAIGRFVVFAALALHEHPEAAEALRTAPAGSADDEVENFVQEVRRFYPFFPLIGGVARHAFDWRGHAFRSGDWALLDLYGTNRDPRIWEDPESFRPARFRGRPIGPDELVPQGAGEPRDGHRCPGEKATIALMHAAVRALLALDYRVPDQDLSVDLSRIPAAPASGFVVDSVRPRAAG